MKVPNPEQTASILSVLLYIFVDPVVFAAYRNSRLGEDELDPLCDSDSAEYLKEISFPVCTVETVPAIYSDKQSL